jgi:hypothetical protein
MTFKNNGINSIVTVKGMPNSLDKSTERSLWERFKCWSSPRLKRIEELADAYADVKVQRETNRARKTMEEAGEIAARRDIEIQKKRILDQQEIHEFSKAVNEIFTNDGIPAEGKALKFAKLIEKNPQIVEQWDKVKYVMEQLSLTRGCKVELVDDTKTSKALPTETQQSES